MPTRFIRTQVTFHHDSGLAKDNMVNTFHVEDDGATGDLNEWHASLDEFYTDDAPGFANSITDLLSGELNGDCTIRSYELTDAEPRVPVFETAFTFTPETNAPLPEEVALCLSYQAAKVSGVNQRRRRGRIYIGPLTVLALAGVNPGDTVGDNPTRPSSTLRGILVASAARLRDHNADTQWTWCVFSPTNLAAPGGSLALAFEPIVEVSCDNAWDTQRRRGLSATNRLTDP